MDLVKALSYTPAPFKLPDDRRRRAGCAFNEQSPIMQAG